MGKFINGKLSVFEDLYDTDGNIVNASDGGIIFAEGKYHWYGQALRNLPAKACGEGGQVTDIGVVMYESTDLVNWKYEGVILACSTNPESELYAPMRFERPKIIYNEKTKQYVLWCHYVAYPGDHGFEIGTGEAGVAVCDTVNGNYKWLGTTRPVDNNGIVRDCTLYKDIDGCAYFIFDRDISMIEEDNRCLYIVKLSEDYLSCTSEYKRIDSAYRREGAAVVYHDGYYYMITSGLTSWDFNQAKYFRTKNLFGEWEDMGDPCIGDVNHTTFNSQTTAIFKVEGKDMYIHMAERHNTENFLHCSYIWLPVEFHSDNTISLEYVEELEIAVVLL